MSTMDVIAAWIARQDIARMFSGMFADDELFAVACKMHQAALDSGYEADELSSSTCWNLFNAVR